jgi:hypothetical protein
VFEDGGDGVFVLIELACCSKTFLRLKVLAQMAGRQTDRTVLDSCLILCLEGCSKDGSSVPQPAGLPHHLARSSEIKR